MTHASTRSPESRTEPTHDLPTLVFVSRRRCGACRRMESLVASVKVTRKKRLRVVELDADRSPELAEYLGVHATPALVLLRGGDVLGRLEERSTGTQIEALIGPHLGAQDNDASTDD